MQHRSLWSVTAVVLLVASLLTGCTSIRATSEQRFRPATAGILTVATTLPAPGFWERDASGTFTGGFEWTIATALAHRFGLQLHVVDVPFDRLVHGDFGGADMAMAQISITDARAEDVDFSAAYHETAAGVLGRDGKELLDLKTAREQTWAVVGGTTEADFVHDVIKPDRDAVVVADDDAAAAAVTAGTVDVALLDVASALVLQAQQPGLDTIARFVTDEHYGVALANRSSNVEVVDAGIRALTADGSLRRAADRWLTSTVDPNTIPIITARST